jgi:type IV pilus assembly protein PilB
VSIVDFRQESKKVNTATLKAMEAVILFENRRLMQLGYVLDWDRFNNLEAVTEQLRRQDMQVQIIQILRSDYNRFIEDQVNKTIQIGKFIKREDTLPDNIVDEIDPTQFTDEDIIKESDAKIKTIAEAVIFAAYKRGASDILIEPQAADYRIRLTIDGLNTVFFDGMPKNYGANIVAHLKVRASMSITERRLPQDGKITLHIKGSPLELRAATMPVRDTNIHQEEKITLRLLSSAVRFPTLDPLGIPKNHLDLIRKALAMANGIIIVTGPTGSGKTTTLYTAIQELDRERLNVVSLEDPIESFIMGITQTQINEAIGLTFAYGLRATLRQAPHVILLGEVRDKEVAHIAVQAANTGHLVLTTLHTNSAIGTFDRLQALGVESHQIADAVRLIMAQRLVPRLCPVCRKSRIPTEMEQIRIQKQTGINLNQPIYYANYTGCRNCHKGYTGRRILTELIPVDSGIRDMILKGQTHSEITRHAGKYFGFRPLMAQAVELVNDGQVDLRDAQKLFLDFYHSEEEKMDDQTIRNARAL